MGMIFRRRPAYEHGVLDEIGRARFLSAHQGEAFVGVDQDQNIIFFSPEAEDMLGWMQEEVKGRPLAMLQPQQYRRRHAEGFARINKEGVDNLRVLFEDTHFEALHKDGHEIPVAIATAAWRGPCGRLYFLAAFREEVRSDPV